MRFSDKMIKGLKPKSKPYVITEESDGRGVGRFQIKVYPSGVVSFQIQYYFELKKRRLEIGKYSVWSLADARKKFYEYSSMVEQGGNPTAEKDQAAAERKKEKALVTMRELISEFLLFADQNWAPNTIKRLGYCFSHDLIPYVGDLSIEQFVEQDKARETIYRVYNRGSIHQAKIFRSNMMSMFKFAIDFDNSPGRFKLPPRYGIKINPIRDITLTVKKVVNQRWLSEDEIRKIWHATDLPQAAQQYFRLAMALAGQRVEEVYKSYDLEYDFKDNILTIPKERIKIASRGDHVVPLSPLALKTIQDIMPNRGTTGALFPHRDKLNEPAHISTLRMAFVRWCDANDMPRFSAKVLRATCKTLMTKAGVPIHIRDILQQHNKRDVATVHYDRYDYLTEKRQGIEIWTDYLKSVIK